MPERVLPPDPSAARRIGQRGLTPEARSGEAAHEERLDRAGAILAQRPRARAGEVRVCDKRFGGWGPCLTRPREPVVPVLVEDVERLVTQLRELCSPSSAAAHGAIALHRTDDIDLLPVVDLIPERL